MNLRPFLTLLCCSLLLSSCHSNPPATTQKSPSDSSIAPPLAVRDTMTARDSAKEEPTEHYDTLDQSTRSHFRDIQAFLDFIKRPNSDYEVGADEWLKKFRIGNIDSFLQFVTIDSLEIDEADADPGQDSLKYSQAMLRQQLTKRKGAAFDLIGEISLHYTIPYPQYSHTIFAVDKTDSIPNLNVAFSGFVLYFRAEHGDSTYKLYRLEDSHISDL